VAILHHAASPKMLNDNFIAWIGRISFSIYLVHAIVRDYLPANQIPDKLDTPSFIVVVLICSYLTERFIERPGILLAKTMAAFQPEVPRSIGFDKETAERHAQPTRGVEQRPIEAGATSPRSIR
jgi:peptidoglycan/LPS O-acetylase OafA/YrhL